MQPITNFSPRMHSPSEIAWSSEHFQPWIMEEQLPLAMEAILKSSPARLAETLRHAASVVASEAVAADLPWWPIQLRFRDVAEDLGLAPAVAVRQIDSAYAAGEQAPAQWVRLARTWLHVSTTGLLFHIPSRMSMPPCIFDVAHRWENPAFMCETSEFLLDRGLMATVAEVTTEPDRPVGFYILGGEPLFNVSGGLRSDGASPSKSE